MCTTYETKEEFKETVTEVVEVMDNMIPVVGPYMDLPIVDKMEAYLISYIVDAIYDLNFREEDEATFLSWSA